MRVAVVVFSGGQDSTTCLIQAQQVYDEVHAITFNYGQRHLAEIEVARTLAAQLGVKAHKVMDVGLLGELALSSLTRDEIPVSRELQHNGLPNTFVPGRNILFLTLSAIYAYQVGPKRSSPACAKLIFLVTPIAVMSLLRRSTKPWCWAWIGRCASKRH